MKESMLIFLEFGQVTNELVGSISNEGIDVMCSISFFNLDMVVQFLHLLDEISPVL